MDQVRYRKHGSGKVHFYFLFIVNAKQKAEFLHLFQICHSLALGKFLSVKVFMLGYMMYSNVNDKRRVVRNYLVLLLLL